MKAEATRQKASLVFRSAWVLLRHRSHPLCVYTRVYGVSLTNRTLFWRVSGGRNRWVNRWIVEASWSGGRSNGFASSRILILIKTERRAKGEDAFGIDTDFEKSRNQSTGASRHSESLSEIECDVEDRDLHNVRNFFRQGRRSEGKDCSSSRFVSLFPLRFAFFSSSTVEVKIETDAECGLNVSRRRRFFTTSAGEMRYPHKRGEKGRALNIRHEFVFSI